MTALAYERTYDPISVSGLSFWARPAEERETAFRILRNERPVSWHKPTEGSLMPPQKEGFWAVVRHADIVHVSNDSPTFSSAFGVQLDEVPEDILQAAESFLGMDAPQHTRMRRLIGSAFTPRLLARVHGRVEDQSERIVDDLLRVGECDFVEQVSMRLPMWTTYELMGLAPDLRDEAAHAAHAFVAWSDEDVADGRPAGELLYKSLVTLLGIGIELAEARRAHPADDLMTNLVHAENDGERLTDEEVGAVFVLLSVASNDTVRNTISLGMKALCDFPDQRRLWLADFDRRTSSAVEEVIRWVTPVMTFGRTAMQDVELAGQQIAKGDRVVMFYSSGNRDESVFDRPHEFRILRQPNNHLGFGGGGLHACLGNALARVQLGAIFRQLLHRAPHLQLGRPQFMVSSFVHAVKSMPCTVG